MGFSFAYLVYSHGDGIDLSVRADPGAAAEVVRRLVPDGSPSAPEVERLIDVSLPPRERLGVAVTPDGVLVAARDANLADPRLLHPLWFGLPEWPVLELLTCRSPYDMTAYARWEEGALTRCIFMDAEDGVVLDLGAPLPFEPAGPLTAALWLDLANAALQATCGLLGDVAPDFAGALDPTEVEVEAFTIG